MKAMGNKQEIEPRLLVSSESYAASIEPISLDETIRIALESKLLEKSDPRINSDNFPYVAVATPEVGFKLVSYSWEHFDQGENSFLTPSFVSGWNKLKNYVDIHKDVSTAMRGSRFIKIAEFLALVKANPALEKLRDFAIFGDIRDNQVVVFSRRKGWIAEIVDARKTPGGLERIFWGLHWQFPVVMPLAMPIAAAA
jgi:hypothetical protein